MVHESRAIAGWGAADSSRESTATALNRLWMMSLAGGVADPADQRGASSEETDGVWSPDGSRFAYHQLIGGKESLMT
jgi:Tol biopolymer transport system component